MADKKLLHWGLKMLDSQRRALVDHPFFSKLLVGAGLMAFAACANTRVAVPRMAPAEVNLAGYKRVAIGGIGGDGAEKIVVDLTAALFETKRFDVLDRQHLHEVVKEQDFGVSGRVSDESAVSIGQMIGSAALVVGDVLSSDYKEDVRQANRKCTKDGKVYDCVEYTRTASARMGVAFKIIDTETGKILVAKNLEAAKTRSVSSHDQVPGALDASDDLLKACRAQLVGDFVKVVAPYQVNVVVELLDDGDLPELEVGNNFARLGNWNDAIAQYSAALAKAEADPEISAETRAKAHYNLGVGFGYSGRYDAGVAELEKAFSLDPDDRYMAQIATIKKFKEDDARLAEQRAGAEEAQ